jgi:hypothetical protein
LGKFEALTSPSGGLLREPSIINSGAQAIENAIISAIDLAEIGGLRNFRISDLASSFPSAAPRVLQSALRRQISAGRLVRPSTVMDHMVIVPPEYQSADVVPIELWLDSFLYSFLALPYYVGYLSAAQVHGVFDEPLRITQVAVEQRRHDLRVRSARIVFYQRYKKSAPVQWHETSIGRIRISTPETTCIDLLRASSPDRRRPHLDRIIRGLLNISTVGGMRDALNAFRDPGSAARLQSIASDAGKSNMVATIAEWRNADSAD